MTATNCSKMPAGYEGLKRINWLKYKMCHQPNDSYQLTENYIGNDKHAFYTQISSTPTSQLAK